MTPNQRLLAYAQQSHQLSRGYASGNLVEAMQARVRRDEQYARIRRALPTAARPAGAL